MNFTLQLNTKHPSLPKKDFVTTKKNTKHPP